MATGNFGHAEGLKYTHYGGIPYYANCGMRAVMPENGKVLSIKLYLGKSTTTNCTAWGMIWDRNTGAILAQSAAQSITNSAPTGLSGLQIYTFAFTGTPRIAKDTPIWIGYGKASNVSGHSLRFGTDNTAAGFIIDTNDTLQSTPGIMSAERSWADEALWVEVVYETGGEVKVWNGTSFSPKPAKMWNGSSWITKIVKQWNGSSWNESKN